VHAEGLKVVPRCGFVRHYIDTHPEFQDLVG
jgi:predicted GNAT family acetyltransferase